MLGLCGARRQFSTQPVPTFEISAQSELREPNAGVSVPWSVSAVGVNGNCFVSATGFRRPRLRLMSTAYPAKLFRCSSWRWKQSLSQTMEVNVHDRRQTG